MTDIFVITDNAKRRIKLTAEQWGHIASEHPGVGIEEIKNVIL